MDAKEFQDIIYLQIQEGLQASDEGRFVDDDEMQRIFNKYKNSSATYDTQGIIFEEVGV